MSKGGQKFMIRTLEELLPLGTDEFHDESGEENTVEGYIDNYLREA
jgi:hypothetical protein